MIIFFLVGCEKENNPAKEDSGKEPAKKAAADQAPSLKVLNFTTITGVNNFADSVSKIEKAYEMIGYEVRIHEMQAKRALYESSNNEKFDGELGRIKDAEKVLTNLIRIKVPVIKLQIYAYFLDNEIKVENWESLNNYSFTYVRGSLYIENKIKKDTGIAVKTYEQCFELLKSGRTQIVVTDIAFENAPWIKELLPKIKKSQNPLSTVEVYHFIHKRHDNLVPAITKSLSQITGNAIEKN